MKTLTIALMNYYEETNSISASDAMHTCVQRMLTLSVMLTHVIYHELTRPSFQYSVVKSMCEACITTVKKAT